MTHRLWLPGKFPGANDMIAAAKNGRGKYNAYSRMKQQWTDHVAMKAYEAHIPAFAHVVLLNFTWVEANRKRDLDNISAAKKFILDGLVAANVLANDGWANVAGFTDAFAVVGRNYPEPGVGVAITDGVP